METQTNVLNAVKSVFFVDKGEVKGTFNREKTKKLFSKWTRGKFEDCKLKREPYGHEKERAEGGKEEGIEKGDWYWLNTVFAKLSLFKVFSGSLSRAVWVRGGTE